MMEQDADTLINALRLWGRIGFFFFCAVALIIGGISVVEGNISLRSVLVVLGILALAFIALVIASLYEWLAEKLLMRRR